MNLQSNIAEDFYSFLSGKASSAISRRLQRNLKELEINITAEQWSVLYCLWQEEGLTQQELANKTFRDKPCITRLINNLEKMDLVIRVNDKNDRRSNLIYLTKEGRRLRDNGMKQATKTITESLDGIDPESIKIAQGILDKVFLNLKR
ncbi:MarR family winged helix-turn-helix transcriptional regulator [Sphingobacterium sp. Mn56C]|uniref:MarR family winged helix-turn-helix transcriptional regulator n=1 Tax=Sphingobacterium sp. Mn56C TaxID=3395261 RepID=UPI003BDC5A61